MKKIAFLTALVVLLSVGIFSCKKDNNSVLIGTWTLTDTLTPSNYIANQTLNFVDNSHYNLITSITGASYKDTGTYSTQYGSLVIFTSTGVTSPCLGLPGTYNYSINGNYLSLQGTLGNDSCNFGYIPRYSYITSTNWFK